MNLDKYIIEQAVVETNFACDLVRCKGACCTFPGGTGAPVLEEEIDKLERAYPVVKHLLPKNHIDVIERQGVAGGVPGARWVRCFNDEACVFVTYDEGIAKCAIQQAYHAGEFDWEKPISCHLFPIRVSGHNKNLLRLESFSECEHAFERGDREEIALVDFVEGALVRRFGKQFTAELQEQARSRAHAPTQTSDQSEQA